MLTPSSTPRVDRFFSLLESCDLLKNVSGPTHPSGHTPDLVLSWSVDKLVLNCHVSDSLSDHYAVHWLANATRPVHPKKTLFLRNLKAIDMEQFASDLLCLPLLNEDTDDIVHLLEWYNTGLTEVLDKHAPLQKRVYTIRPDNPWNNQTIALTRKKVRRLEIRWKTAGLTIDRKILHHALVELKGLISAA